MQKEPVMIYGSLGTLIGALLMALMQQFMPDIGGDLMTAIVELVVFLIPILIGMWVARSKVTPVSNPHTADGQPAQLVALDK